MTDIYIIDTNYNVVGIIDNYSSAIFTRRYWECGDFELYIKANRKSLEILQPNYYVRRDGDTYIYVVESIQLTTSQEDGDFLTVKGRSVESMLNRRILYNHRNENLSQPYTIGGFNVDYPTDTCKTVEDCIRNAIEITIAPTDLNPYGVKWAWDGNFILGGRQGFSETMPQTQILGAYLYDFIVEQCQTYGYGFKVHLNNNSKFEFNLYKGRDCSYNQTDNPYIVFSPEFDNLSNTNYIFDITNYKNFAYGIGKADIEDERLWNGKPLKNGGNVNMINRRELFVDGSSISNEEKDINGDNVIMSENKYAMYVGNNAYNELIKYPVLETFDGDVISNNMSYNLGDIVQIINEYGISATARIVEIIECEDESGYSIVPKFTTWEV